MTRPLSACSALETIAGSITIRSTQVPDVELQSRTKVVLGRNCCEHVKGPGHSSSSSNIAQRCNFRRSTQGPCPCSFVVMNQCGVSAYLCLYLNLASGNRIRTLSTHRPRPRFGLELSSSVQLSRFGRWHGWIPLSSGTAQSEFHWQRRSWIPMPDIHITACYSFVPNSNKRPTRHTSSTKNNYYVVIPDN